MRRSRPLFVCRSIELACEQCKSDGRAHECVHLLHLVPRWQSEERHRKLKIMMQDRPDLIQSELAGLAFDSLQQVFRKADIAKMFETPPLPLELHQMVWLVIDPAGVLLSARCCAAPARVPRVSELTSACVQAAARSRTTRW